MEVLNLSTKTQRYVNCTNMPEDNGWFTWSWDNKYLFG